MESYAENDYCILYTDISSYIDFITDVLIGKDASLSAAIGLSLFDLLSPGYAMWAPFSFVIKDLTVIEYALSIFNFT